MDELEPQTQPSTDVVLPPKLPESVEAAPLTSFMPTIEAAVVQAGVSADYSNEQIKWADDQAAEKTAGSTQADSGGVLPPNDGPDDDGINGNNIPDDFINKVPESPLDKFSDEFNQPKEVADKYYDEENTDPDSIQRWNNKTSPPKSIEPVDYSPMLPDTIGPIDSSGPVGPDKNAAALQMPKPTDYLINGISSSEPRPGETNYTQTPGVKTQFN